MKPELPTLAELRDNELIAYQNDALNAILNVETPKKWVKQHPFAKNVKYLPIDKVEYLMTKIFQVWNPEVIEFKQLFNSVSVHVRVHYKDPLTGEMRFQDGVGAVGIQTDKGASASDMGSIKSDAVMKALPAAKSYAIKDACEHIGKIFGRDLNRPDALGYEMSTKDPKQTKADLIELFELKKDNLSKEQIENFDRIINNKEVNSYQKAINELKSL